jgi:hypothetical protein
MNVVLWILQVLLGAFFVFHSTLLLRPTPQLKERGMDWVFALPAGLRMFAGAAEGLGGIALVVPALLHVLVWLTPLAAAGLVVLMIGAAVFHLPRHEYPNIGLNSVLGVLAAFIAWGRFGPYHF